ncbi:MAG: type III-A CRISPR-associated RAMP protein Csm5 [Candidatus Micrarchaeia archaeon]
MSDGEREVERRTLEIKTLSPILIGSGEKARIGYDYIRQDGRAIRVDIEKLTMLLDEKGIEDLVGSMRKPDEFSIEKFVNEKKIEPKDIAAYYLENHAKQDFERTYEVHVFIKDGLGRPYIPGSSIKGSIKGCLVYDKVKIPTPDKMQELIRNRELRDHLRGIVVEIEKSLRERRFGLRDVYSDAPSDAMLALCPLEIHRERDGALGEMMRSRRGRGSKLFGEFIPPNLSFKTEMWVKNFGDTEELNVTRILGICSERCRRIVEAEIRFFGDYGAFSAEYERVVDFYKKLKEEKMYLLRLGMGSSFFMTSVFSEDERLRRELLPRRRSRNAESCPNSRKLCRYNGSLFPPGWVAVEVK